MNTNVDALIVFGFSKHKVFGTAFTPAISYKVLGDRNITCPCWDSNPGKRKRFILSKTFRTRSGVHSAYCSLDNEVPSQKQSGRGVKLAINLHADSRLENFRLRLNISGD